MDRVFLDANVLLSAAWSNKTGLLRLWTLPDIRLLTSMYAREEARINLPDEVRQSRLEELLEQVVLVPEAYDRRLPEEVSLPAKDRPILLAALAARATHLLTGDLRHFGPLYGRTVGGLEILPPAEYFRRH